MLIVPVRRDGLWLAPDIDQAAARLAELDLQHGDRLGVGLPDTPATVALIQAAYVAGVVLVPFNRRLDADTIREQAQRARLRQVLTVGDHPLASWPLPTPSARPVLSDDQEEHESLILFTSGTTGPAKAARIPRRAVQHALSASCARLGLTADDVWLGCLPLDHIAGIGNALRMLACGYRLVQLPRFDAGEVNRCLDDESITGLSLVPTQLHRLIAARGRKPWPASLRTILVGGGPLAADLRQRCVDLGCAPRQTYGLTECCAMVTCQTEAGEDCGPALDGLELRLVEEVIAVRGPTVFLGYEGEAGGPDPDGWFVTGDHGALDSAGRLTVLGRRTDLIISGGENIYPAQVEARLRAIPGVVEVAVVGLPDAEWGQVVAAVVVGDGKPATDQAWLEGLAGLPGPWRPKRWVWATELPRTALGKVQRGALRALFP